MHNALHITEPVPTEPHQMWDRPFRVVWGDFPGALRDRISDPEVIHIADRWPTGGIDEFRDMLSPPRYRDSLLGMFD